MRKLTEDFEKHFKVNKRAQSKDLPLFCSSLCFSKLCWLICLNPGRISTKTDPQQKQRDLDKKTQEKLDGFFSTVLPGLCENEPTLNRTKKQWQYSNQDFWPQMDWHEENWVNLLFQSLLKLEKRLGSGVHYQQLEAAFAKIFASMEEEEDEVQINFDF